MDINFLAVFAAALAAFLIGGLWYSPALFQKPWMAANRLTDADLTGGNMMAIFGGSFLLSLIMAANLAAFLADPATTTAWGATAGFLAGFGWIALGIAVVGLFERRPISYALINGGYWTVTMTAMGAILGAWR